MAHRMAHRAPFALGFAGLLQGATCPEALAEAVLAPVLRKQPMRPAQVQAVLKLAKECLGPDGADALLG